MKTALFPAVGSSVVAHAGREIIRGVVLRTYDGTRPTVIIDDTEQEHRRGSKCSHSEVSVPLESLDKF
jgi:hypothetical protein